MTMKKKILTTFSVVLILGMAALGILAYLSDTDSDVNVMTLGNVEIEQIEQEWKEGKLVDFKQAKPLYPYVGTLGWDNTTEDNGAYRQFTMNNVVDKYVSVENTGESDAYVRTFIALEMGDYSYDEFDMVGISINAENGSEFQFDGAWNWTDEFVAEVNGENYYVMVAVHEDDVASGETTIPSLLQVYLSKDATNETVEKLDGNGNGTYEILAFSEAVQAKGFDNAVAALNTAFGDTANGYHPWGDGVNIPVVLSDVDDMRAAMKNPGAKIVLDDDMIIDDDKGTGYALYAKYNCEIDLNGNDIKVNMPDKEFYGIVHALKGAKVDIVGDGNIEINGGIGQFIWCTGGADSATDKPADGTTVNIYGGNWIQDYSKVDVDTNNFVEGIYANRGGIINIYGGKFQWKNAEKYTVNESRGGIINIYGGTFINFDPRVSHDNDGSYVAEGYTVVSEIQANGDVWYTVVPE